MALFNPDDDFSPAFTYGDRPVYWSTAVVIVHAIFFCIGGILWGASGPLGIMIFEYSRDTGEAFPQLWRLLTYPYLDFSYYSQMGFWLIICLYILFHNGQSVERFLGRTVFLQLYVALILIPGLVVATIDHFFGGFALAGVLSIAMGMMVANSTIYPDGETAWFPLPYSIAVKLFLAINCVICFAVHDYGSIVGMIVASVVAYFGMRFSGAGRGMDAIVDWRESRRQAKIAKKVETQVVRKIEAETTLDSVLEKISQKGLASLSPSERTILQRASAELKKRDRK